MKQASYQEDAILRQMIAELAEWWGMPATRYNSKVIREAVMQVHANAKARRELAEFDKLSDDQKSGEIE